MSAVINRPALRGIVVDPGEQLGEILDIFFIDQEIAVEKFPDCDDLSEQSLTGVDFILLVHEPGQTIGRIGHILQNRPGMPVMVSGLENLEEAIEVVNAGAVFLHGKRIKARHLALFLDRIKQSNPEKSPPQRPGSPQVNSDSLRAAGGGEPVGSSPSGGKKTLALFWPSFSDGSVLDRERVYSDLFARCDISLRNSPAAMFCHQGTETFQSIFKLYTSWLGINPEKAIFFSGPDLKGDGLESFISRCFYAEDTDPSLFLLGQWEDVRSLARDEIFSHLREAFHRLKARKTPIFRPLILGQTSPLSDPEADQFRFSHYQLAQGCCPLIMPGSVPS